MLDRTHNIIIFITKKKDKGVALLLTLFILIALSSMSIAMLSIIQTSSKNTVRAHRSVVTNQAAEFGIETGRVSLVEEFSEEDKILTNDIRLDRNDRTYSSEKIARNEDGVFIWEDVELDELESEEALFTEKCLALHGYTASETDSLYRYIYYSQASNIISKYPAVSNPDDAPNENYNIYSGESVSFSNQDDLYENYSYIYFLQRVGMDETFDGFNFELQNTYESDTDLFDEPFDGLKRIFYRIISCGFGPDKEYIVPLKAYFSIGGRARDPEGIIRRDTTFSQKNVVNEGFYRP